DRPNQIERDDEKPEQRTYSHREERKHSQDRGCQVPIRGERGEASGQAADNAWKDKHQPEEAKAVQGCDGALRSDQVHRLEPRQDVRAEAKQPRDITKNELQIEDGLRRHLTSLRIDAASNTAVIGS